MHLLNGTPLIQKNVEWQTRGPTEWESDHFSLPTRGHNWPSWHRMRKWSFFVTHAGSQLTFMTQDEKGLWKLLLLTKVLLLEDIEKQTYGDHIIPSTWGGTRESSLHLEESIKALPRIKVRDSLPNSWPVTSPSCRPLLLAAAICRTCYYLVF